MSNRTYICFEYRSAKRAEACGGLNNDDKGWRELEQKVLNEKEEWISRRTELGQEKIKDIDRLIEHYNKQKDSEKKSKKVKALSNQRNRIINKYTEQSPDTDGKDTHDKNSI